MRTQGKWLLGVFAASCLGLPSVAMAGAAGVILTLSPVRVPASTSVPETVPFMSPGLVVALGVLLAVIAFRFLRHRKTYQKVLAIAVLGGGVMAGSWGVNRVEALIISVAVPPENPVCGGTSGAFFATGMTGTSPYLIENQCKTYAIKIDDYGNMPCAPASQVKADADVGDTIAPGASATANYCP